MTYNRSEIMKDAWMIRRTEGRTMAYAMKKAWMKAKLLTIGNLWEKYGKSRIYMDSRAVLDLCKVKIGYYKTGNVHGVTVDGIQQSNADGRRWLYSADKLYYDFADNAFHGDGAHYDDIVRAVKNSLHIA